MAGSSQQGDAPFGIDALDPSLKVIRREPPNAEAPLAQQVGVITPNRLHYVRNNFTVPRIEAAGWQLSIEGEVAQPLTLSYADLRSLPTRSLLVTLECAGNGRLFLPREAEGEQWEYGAVSTAEWTGVPLSVLLEAAGVTERAQDIVIEGADGGAVKELDTPTIFARSMTPEQARHPDVLLAWAMNGEPLPLEHGFPARLVVPGWYGMAAVKWVQRIRAIPERFEGLYQTYKYMLHYPDQPRRPSVPLTSMQPRALVVEPLHGATHRLAPLQVRGVAWCGTEPLDRVEVSTDGGHSWQAATFTSPEIPYTWRRWEVRIEDTRPGTLTIRSRAVTSSGVTQPATGDWNSLGYANNAVQVVTLTVD
jgi:DMSO/TMAO reductase YedYZ molybdopterin-dependent catalytic subunit